MATATRPRNRDRILRKIVANIIAGQAASADVGAATWGRLRSKVWVCAGTPSGAAPTGMLAKDVILDTTGNKVFRYISGTNYKEMTATT